MLVELEKHPFVLKFKNLLMKKRVPIIIKKKYKGQKDEIELLKKYSKLLVCEKESGNYRSNRKKFDAIILDDGFQDIEYKKRFKYCLF